MRLILVPLGYQKPALYMVPQGQDLGQVQGGGLKRVMVWLARESQGARLAVI